MSTADLHSIIAYYRKAPVSDSRRASASVKARHSNPPAAAAVTGDTSKLSAADVGVIFLTFAVSVAALVVNGMLAAQCYGYLMDSGLPAAIAALCGLP